MGLGAKEIFLTLTGVTHLGITCLSHISSRGRRRDDGNIHQGALVHQQTTLAQHGNDGLEEGLGQARRLQPMAKLEQRDGVRYRFAAQIEAVKTPKGLAVIDGIFQRLVGQPKPLLQEVEAQHPHQAQR